MLKIIISIGVLLTMSLCISAKTIEDVKTRLQDPFIEALYKKTYNSIIERSEPDGYFQESVNGAYAGMFPRTVGGLTSLYLETGELKKAKSHVDLVLKNSKANKLNRSAHVISRPVSFNVEDTNPEYSNSNINVGLYRLDMPYAGAQYFKANGNDLKAIYAYLSGDAGDFNIVCTVSENVNTPVLGISKIHVNQVGNFNDWTKFTFDIPLKLEKDKMYLFKIQTEKSASSYPIWMGVNHEIEDDNIYSIATDNGKDWMYHKSNKTAFVVDFGDNIKWTKKEDYKILSRGDQVDGNLHVLASWAMIVLNSDEKKWEAETYEQVASMLDVVMDMPYKTYRADRIFPGLVKNHMLEHSREVRYWDCWDILTQSWALRTLELMIQVAEKRGDTWHMDSWTADLIDLNNNVNTMLTMTIDDKKVYAEMRLANSGDGKIFEGLSWVNFGMTASQYSGFDKEIIKNTYDVFREKATLNWKGFRVWGDEWDFNGRIAPQVIGKGVGWDIAYSMEAGDHDWVCDWLDFIKSENYTNLYAEAFNLINGETVIQDDGNGEQTSWWCWGMAKARKVCNLPVVPN